MVIDIHVSVSSIVQAALCCLAFFALQTVKRSFTICEPPWLVPFKVSDKYVPTWEVRDSAVSMFIRSFISTNFPTFRTAPSACICMKLCFVPKQWEKCGSEFQKRSPRVTRERVTRTFIKVETLYLENYLQV